MWLYVCACPLFLLECQGIASDKSDFFRSRGFNSVQSFSFKMQTKHVHNPVGCVNAYPIRVCLAQVIFLTLTVFTVRPLQTVR